jgi:hypothetical protein
MKAKTILFCSYVFAVVLICAASPAAPQAVRYGTGSWEAEALGNHRAVVRVAEAADAIWAHLPWRRRDSEPEKKNILVIEESSGKKISNLIRMNVFRAYGDVVFQAPGAGNYFIYYLPYLSKGRNYPVVTYQPPDQAADPAWLKTTQAALLRSDQRLPQAALVEFQAIDEFNSFSPMEIIATPEETAELLKKHADQKYLLFPEDRRYPIRMAEDLPQKWIQEGPRAEFAGEADRGEYYAFQIGVFAAAADIQNLSVRFTALRNGSRTIPGSAMHCINLDGVNWDGSVFGKTVPVPKGKIQALWFGIDIPKDAMPGKYSGRVTVEPTGMPTQTVNLTISISQNVIADHGDDEPWRHSRLRWLDSMLAFDDEIVRPFTPIRLTQNKIGILGRQLSLAATGLPAQVESYFSPEVTKILSTPKPLLAGPMDLVVEDSAGRRVKWVRMARYFTDQHSDGIHCWNATLDGESLKLEITAEMEFDGFVQYKITVSALKPFQARDIRLEIPLVKEAARYMMGLGLKGGYRPASLDWTWDVKRNQDGAWLGNANAGLQFSLRAENYARPLNTNFYQSKPLNMPPSWFNEGKGGIKISETDPATVLVQCFSGSRAIQPGKDLHFDFNLLLTPFKPLDTQFQWSTRFFHAFRPVDDAIKAGSNTINVHHANDVNPYINYPFIHQQQMKTYIDEAHRKGLKVKIYNTIRELSNRAPEIFALRSLGDEIFSTGPGGGFSWLQEHIGANYIAAWFVPQLKDAAIINSGMSRWHNYYIEGMNWLVNKMQIDGIYIDDVAFDRTTMKRVRKVLDRGRPAAVIDLHSANQYNPRDGFTNSANLYMEHFPYINRLWFGEYFDPNSPPDFWFIEMSGIPYGLMGEMLQDGGNKWRGMLYGMTNRMPYGGNDPSPIWKVWDDFKIQESEMFGYWSPRCPVKTDNKDILATAYVKQGKALVSIASWAQADANVRLAVDWRALGIDPAKAVLTAPEIRDFQPAAKFGPNDPIPVPKDKGWLLIVG